jgi:hypothetical protein
VLNKRERERERERERVKCSVKGFMMGVFETEMFVYGGEINQRNF